MENKKCTILNIIQNSLKVISAFYFLLYFHRGGEFIVYENLNELHLINDQVGLFRNLPCYSTRVNFIIFRYRTLFYSFFSIQRKELNMSQPIGKLSIFPVRKKLFEESTNIFYGLKE